uniref:GAGE domain-containing protein n=1 Tax=Mesocestoides corti TaxID=53468 RepID=A0A5K3FCW6_MESCO
MGQVSQLQSEPEDSGDVDKSAVNTQDERGSEGETPQLSPEKTTDTSNEDLEEIERSLAEMQRYVEELQFEVLKHRQEEEAKRLQETQPPLPINEFIEGKPEDNLSIH